MSFKRVSLFAGGIIGIIGFVISLFFGSVFVMGGYWENSPVLDRISGPSRFKQFVVDPIPNSIYDLRGGYSGFPRGRVTTYFKYRGNFNDHPFLKEWSVSDMPESYFDWTGLSITNIYIKKRMGTTRNFHLLIDDNVKRGLFYIPAG